MRKIIEYTLISADGVFADPAGLGFMKFRDDAYLRDGLGLLTSCDAMVMGRNFYNSGVQSWPNRPEHPWSDQLNRMRKYVYSTTLTDPEWTNTTVEAGSAVPAIRQLKQHEGGDLIIWGHTQLAETLMRED